MMNSKKSYSNISLPLIAENLKRFWLGSALAFLGYFFSCCVPVLMSQRSESFITTLLGGTYPPIVVLLLLVPTIAAALLYKYLHQQSSVAIMHSLPFSRKQIYHSGFLSGVILTVAPVVLTGIALLLISVLGEPVYFETFDPEIGFIQTNVFAVTAILKWVFSISVLTVAVFVLSLFAAMLTGSTLIQMILSVILLFLAPILLFEVDAYCTTFLFGYIRVEWISTLCSYLAPIAAYIMPRGMMQILCYLCGSLVLYVVSYYLYKKRPLEKATDTLIFNISKPIIKYLCTFIGMSCGAMFLYSLSESQEIFIYLGALIGALVTYVVVDMLIQKRLRIKGFVKGFSVYVLAAALFFCVFALDVTGFETHLPDAADVNKVYLNGLTNEYINSGNTLSSDYVTKEMIALQQDIIDDRENLERQWEESEQVVHGIYNGFTALEFTYYLENGRKMQRSYQIPKKWISDNRHAKNIVQSEDFKKYFYEFLRWEEGDKDMNLVEVLPSYMAECFGKTLVSMNQEDRISQLFGAFREDLLSLTADQMDFIGNRTGEPLLALHFRVRNHDQIDEAINAEYFKRYGSNYYEDYDYYTYQVNKYCTGTIALLKEWGWYDMVTASAEDVDYVEVIKYQQIQESYSEENAAEVYDRKTDAIQTELHEEGRIQIRDKDQIAQILDTAITEIYDYEMYYEISFVPVKGNDENLFLYYSGENIPAFIENAFE